MVVWEYGSALCASTDARARWEWLATDMRRARLSSSGVMITALAVFAGCADVTQAPDSSALRGVSPAAIGPGAPWSAPVTIGASGLFAGYPSIAFAADGSGLVTWLPRDDEDDPNPASRLLTLAPGARPGATRRVSGRLLAPPALYARNGVALLRGRALWSERRRVSDARVSVAFGTTRRPVGRWRTLAALKAPAVVGGHAALAVSQRGHAIVGWVEDTRLRVAVRAPGQDFGAPATLARVRHQLEELSFALAIGARGDAVVIYTSTKPFQRGSGGTVLARVRPAGQPFAPAQRLGPTRGRTSISAAVAPDGGAIIAWGSVDPGEEINQPYDVFAAGGTIGRRRFGAAQALERGEYAQYPSGDLSAAIAANGTATVAFSPARRGDDPVMVATARVGRRFNRPAQLALGSAEAVASDADGNAIVVWTHDGRVRAAKRVAGTDTFGSPEDVSSASETAASADIALDPISNRATVVWDSVPAPEQLDAPAPAHAVRLAQRSAD